MVVITVRIEQPPPVDAGSGKSADRRTRPQHGNVEAFAVEAHQPRALGLRAGDRVQRVAEQRGLVMVVVELAELRLDLPILAVTERRLHDLARRGVQRRDAPRGPHLRLARRNRLGDRRWAVIPRVRLDPCLVPTQRVLSVGVRIDEARRWYSLDIERDVPHATFSVWPAFTAWRKHGAQSSGPF